MRKITELEAKTSYFYENREYVKIDDGETFVDREFTFVLKTMPFIGIGDSEEYVITSIREIKSGRTQDFSPDMDEEKRITVKKHEFSYIFDGYYYKKILNAAFIDPDERTILFENKDGVVGTYRLQNK